MNEILGFLHFGHRTSIGMVVLLVALVVIVIVMLTQGGGKGTDGKGTP